MPAPTIGPILLIEDDVDVRDAITDFLEGDGYEVAAAPDGRRAIADLKAGLRPALILLDYMMPHMNALEFCNERRRLGIAPDVPIVVLSAASTLTTVAEECGAAEAIQKPFDLDDLVRVAARYAVKKART